MTREFTQVFTPEEMDAVFPPQRTSAFFEALFGDDEEGAYDIRLRFDSARPHELRFSFELRQRPGRCLACNLTYGLPHVFRRHPVIDVAGVVRDIGIRLDGQGSVKDWRLGDTRELSRELHVIPLVVSLS